MKVFSVFVALLLASPAIAQQQPTPIQQALGERLMREVNEGLQCSASLIGLQQELAKALARVKDLEEKAKPAVN